MFAAGSIKSSKWGWDTKNYTLRYDASYTGGGTTGCWSPLTLAPNGFYYALPRVWTKNSLSTGTPANDVLCFKPGKSNNKTNKWESGTVYLVPGSGGKQPSLPSANPSYVSSAQNRFPSKGVLAPNGYIYFFGWAEFQYVRIRPQLDPNDNPLTATEWDVIDYSTTTPQINTNKSYYSGAVLGQDGHIYLIPCSINSSTTFANQKTIRIKPRNTSINATNLDVIETGYYDGTTSVKSFNKNPGPFYPGFDSSGATLTQPSDVTTPWGYSTIAGFALSNGISHPNGKIYLFGGSTPRIYILDPTKWNTTSEIYTSNTLYFPTNLTGVPTHGWFGQGFTATLEKLKPGQDPNTLKIIFGYGGKTSSTTDNTTKLYTASIVFDPVAETFTPYYDASTNEGLTLLSIQTGSAAQNASSSFINLPNGHIFQSTISQTVNNRFGKLIYFNNDQLKYIGPQNRSILSSVENIPIYNTYTNTAGDAGWASSTPGIKSSFGKTLYSSIYGAVEVTSVKGFYPNIKHFSYTDDDSDIYDIPSDLSTLPTSLWNAYFNKPR